MAVPQTILEALDAWAVRQPEKIGLSFLDDFGDVRTNLSYFDIVEQSVQVANHLLDDVGVKRGDRGMLVYPPSLDFIVAFLGCLRAGLIAVPAFPPDPTSANALNKDLGMFKTICNSCEAKVALTSSLYDYATKLASIKSAFASSHAKQSWPELNWIVTDNILQKGVSTRGSTGGSRPKTNTKLSCKGAVGDIAFLQYTSGSTSDPKGVMITQKSLAHNLKLITTGLSAVDDTVVVSWLPQYHDMGLIGSYLGCLYCGGSGYYLSPISWIRNPPVWIRAMSTYKATHMQAPNFAYSLTAKKFLARERTNRKHSDSKGLDLSHVRHMINAAGKSKYKSNSKPNLKGLISLYCWHLISSGVMH